MTETAASRPAPTWLKPAVEYGPLAAFFIAYYAWGLLPATGVLMVVTLVGLALSWIYTRKVAMMPLITAGVVGVFGGLTLWLNDDTFIKMKPTIIPAVSALILLGGLATGRALLKPLLGQALPMDDAGWRKLTLRFALFFLFLAGLNEAVWRTQSTDFWVNFKVFGIMGLTFAFILTQTGLIHKHRIDPEKQG